MQLSRVSGDGLALFALTLDQTPEVNVLDELLALPDVLRDLKMVKL
jgi:hypothetical protein